MKLKCLACKKIMDFTPGIVSGDFVDCGCPNDATIMRLPFGMTGRVAKDFTLIECWDEEENVWVRQENPIPVSKIKLKYWRLTQKIRNVLSDIGETKFWIKIVFWKIIPHKHKWELLVYPNHDKNKNYSRCAYYNTALCVKCFIENESKISECTGTCKTHGFLNKYQRRFLIPE